MTTYPPAPDARFAHLLESLLRRVTTLEQRTALIDSGKPVHSLTGTVDPSYSSGDPKVTITGSGALTGPYQHASSYTPAANDSVLLIPQGTTYVVVDKLV